MKLKFNIEKYHYVFIVGWIAKIFTVFFSFLSTRYLIELLGIQGYAAYAILFSIGGWFSILNFGMPNAIQNLIAKYSTEKKDINIILESLLFIMVIGIIILIPITFFIANIIHINLMFDYNDIITIKSIICIFVLFTLFGLSQIFYKVLYAKDRGFLPNIYPLIIAILSFVILIFLKFLNIKDVGSIIILFILPYFFIFLLSYYQSIGLLRPKYNKIMIIEIYHASKYFFISTIFVYATLNIDYMIMAKVLTEYEITQYSLLMKIFGLILFLQATMLSSSWSHTSKAYHMGNSGRINEILKNNLIVGFIIVCLFGSFVYKFNNDIFELLSGDIKVTINDELVILISSYMLIRVWTDSFATTLSSMNYVRISIYIVPIQALISIIAQSYLSEKYALNGIIIGLILSFLLTVSIIYPIYFLNKIKKLKEIKHEK